MSGYTDQQHDEFKEMSRAMIAWLNEICNPHTVVVITPVSAQLSSGEIGLTTEEFLRD